ncbi:MAG: hypothetical protein HND38_13890 [Planctomycetes bacterium]|nr:hypothetical protein [Planctomycetota bacterium]
MKYYKKPVTIVFLFVASLLGIGLSYCFAQAESEVHGVAIVSMDVPLSVSIGKKVNIEIVVGNEQKTKVATILTVTCHETGQQIGREALNLDGSSSKKNCIYLEYRRTQGRNLPNTCRSGKDSWRD